MPNKKVRELNRTLTSLDEDLLIIEQSNGTKTITKKNLLKEINTKIDNVSVGGEVDLSDYASKTWVDEKIANSNLCLNSIIKVQNTQPTENDNLVWLETETQDNNSGSVLVKNAIVQGEEPIDTEKLWFDL